MLSFKDIVFVRNLRILSFLQKYYEVSSVSYKKLILLRCPRFLMKKYHDVVEVTIWEPDIHFLSLSDICL